MAKKCNFITSFSKPSFVTYFQLKQIKSEFFVGPKPKKKRGRPRLEDMTEEQKKERDAKIKNNKVDFHIDAFNWLSDWLTRALL